MDATTLVLERRLDAPRAAVWRCWTEPPLLRRFFVPRPHEVIEAVVDPRPGGRFFTRMRVEGVEHPSDGSFLAVEPGRRLVFTDLLLAGWQPAPAPGLGFTAEIALEENGDGTAYTATARHGTAESAERHRAMGFHEGWGMVADQLEALAREVAAGTD